MSPLRIAWIGTARDSGGVPGMGTDLLEGVLAHGASVELFTTELPEKIAPRVSRFPSLVIYTFASGWQYDRWYSRRPIPAFLTSSAARTWTYKRIARDIIRRNTRRPYDLIFQVSQTELFDLGRHSKLLPPIVVYPCVHAAGELRWHRRESHYARQSEKALTHFLIRSLLWARTNLQRRELRKPAKIIGMSRRFNELLSADYGVSPARQAVLYHPIRAAGSADGDLPPQPPPRSLGRPARLLYVARLSVRKGLEMIIDLSRRLDDLAGQIEIEIIGGRTMWSDYSKHLADLNPNVASYGGELSHHGVQARLAAADALLLPSHYEPGGLVVGEALAQGTPVVVSDEVGSGELVSPVCCRKFPAGDAAAFEREVRSLIDDLRKTPNAIRATAASEARRHFSVRKVGADLTAILTDAARGKGRP